jgi:hypothetical protein
MILGGLLDSSYYHNANIGKKAPSAAGKKGSLYNLSNLTLFPIYPFRSSALSWQPSSPVGKPAFSVAVKRRNSGLKPGIS